MIYHKQQNWGERTGKNAKYMFIKYILKIQGIKIKIDTPF